MKKMTILLLFIGLLLLAGKILVQFNMENEPGNESVSSMVINNNYTEGNIWTAPLQLKRSTGIDPNSPPHIKANKYISQQEIWQENDERQPRNTTIELVVQGKGNPAIDFNSQDVIFTIDCSSSMDYVDPTYLRRDAAKSYVSQLILPDMAAVIEFSNQASLVGGHHLSNDYEAVIEDLNELENGGQTNFSSAIELTNHEFINYGEKDKNRVCILLTDGRPEPSYSNVTMDILNQTIENNITIFTIGLYQFGSGTLLDEDLLKWLAKKTGGNYYIAEKPEDLVAVYDSIAMRFRNYTAGYDPDVMDNDPMIRDIVPDGFNIDMNSFTLMPDALYLDDDSNTYVEWNISCIYIGDIISIQYNISSNLFGRIDLHPYGLSRVHYYLNENAYSTYFPPVTVWVLSSIGSIAVPPPPPPPPPPTPPPPPPGGYPIPLTTPASPTIIPLTTPASLPTASTTGVLPIEYVVGGFLGLGIAERIKLRKRLAAKQKISVGT